MISFVLNLPWTITGLIVGLISAPTKMKFNNRPRAFIWNVRSFWWAFGYMKNARAMTIGQVILLGPNLADKDFEHELVHVEQYEKAPLVHPILYYMELMRKGYRNNKYEQEAYSKAGNYYKKN
jgi:hypothetical protein